MEDVPATTWKASPATAGADESRSYRRKPFATANDHPDFLNIVIQQEGAGPPSTTTSTKEWLKSLMNGDHNGDAAAPENAPCRTRIQRVPKMLREVKANRKCYSPGVVSFGPFHSDKELQVTEKTKMKWARHFISRSSTTNVDEFYARVEKTAKTTRHCYEHGSTDAFDDDAFARMMFLDGCFILQFVDCCAGETGDDMNMKSHDVAFVTRDLFLLENQIPFEVLKCLMILRYGSFAEGMPILQEFIKQRFQVGPVSHPVDPLHLLDLLRRNKTLVRPSRLRKPPCYRYRYRSAKKLESAGIHIRPRKTLHLTDVRFQSYSLSAKLELPPIAINSQTKTILLNLAAYETCYNVEDPWVTSYICFMDSLIDDVEDVMELSSNGVFHNLLGTNQQVADLFNDMANSLIPDPNIYSHAKECIERHFEKKTQIWMREWVRANFTFLAFVGAISAIVLSCLQTYFTIFPRK
ncbi:uncharacterized protein LOC131167453 [Malania oleifera]|uniref:uncharacterized protein LOC131167453 n=1 Tax=Malania oleifera TaxID=397392 RepID=UPI0025ADA8F7|nr:uncharacterized protein LOC131167453 [Malania oleifera]